MVNAALAAQRIQRGLDLMAGGDPTHGDMDTSMDDESYRVEFIYWTGDCKTLSVSGAETIGELKQRAVQALADPTDRVVSSLRPVAGDIRLELDTAELSDDRKSLQQCLGPYATVDGTVLTVLLRPGRSGVSTPKAFEFVSRPPSSSSSSSSAPSATPKHQPSYGETPVTAGPYRKMQADTIEAADYDDDDDDYNHPGEPGQRGYPRGVPHRALLMQGQGLDAAADSRIAPQEDEQFHALLDLIYSHVVRGSATPASGSGTYDGIYPTPEAQPSGQIDLSELLELTQHYASIAEESYAQREQQLRLLAMQLTGSDRLDVAAREPGLKEGAGELQAARVEKNTWVRILCSRLFEYIFDYIEQRMCRPSHIANLHWSPQTLLYRLLFYGVLDDVAPDALPSPLALTPRDSSSIEYFLETARMGLPTLTMMHFIRCAHGEDRFPSQDGLPGVYAPVYAVRRGRAVVEWLESLGADTHPFTDPAPRPEPWGVTSQDLLDERIVPGRGGAGGAGGAGGVRSVHPDAQLGLGAEGLVYMPLHGELS